MDTLESQTAMLESFAYGLLQGMSFNETVNCKAGLFNTIYYAFDALDYREIYLPWNTLKFGVATTKLTEATNTIYT
jgi:hypothetical protein